MYVSITQDCQIAQKPKTDFGFLACVQSPWVCFFFLSALEEKFDKDDKACADTLLQAKQVDQLMRAGI